MVRRKSEGLTDIPVEEEVVDIEEVEDEIEEPIKKLKPPKKNLDNAANVSYSELSFQSPEEAQKGLKELTRLLTMLHIWALNENLKNLLAIDVNYRPKPSIKDGKVLTDANGVIQYDQPGVSIQIRVPIIAAALGLPLDQAVYLPSAD